MTRGRLAARHRPLRHRLLTSLLTITVLVLAGFNVATLLLLRDFELAETDAVITHALASNAGRAGDLLADARAGHRSEVVSGGYYLAVVTADGAVQVVAGDPHAGPRLPADLTAVAGSGAWLTVPGSDGHGSFRLHAVSTSAGILVAAANLDTVAGRIHHLIGVLAAGTAVALLVLGLTGTAVVRHGLRPLEAMAGRADRISGGDLSDRVAPEDPHSEVGRLGVALNQMLARIEAAVREQEANQRLVQRFFADASHELRTPLASLLAHAELYEQGALHGPGQVDEAMRRIRVSAQRMSGLVDDMLRLARLDQHPPLVPRPIELGTLVTDRIRDARDAGPEHHWHTDVASEVRVTGDAELLRRAVDNLLANVRIHTPAGTTASVALRRDGGYAVLDVADDGPGVPEAALPRLFDRFYRAVPERAAGSGLGLAIVAEVAAAHRGAVTAANAGPGLRIQLRLPASG